LIISNHVRAFGQTLVGMTGEQIFAHPWTAGLPTEHGEGFMFAPHPWSPAPKLLNAIGATIALPEACSPEISRIDATGLSLLPRIAQGCSAEPAIEASFAP